MPSTSPLKVSTRLAFGFGLAVSLGLVIAAVGASRMLTLSRDLHEVSNDRMVKIEQFTTLKDNLNASGRALRNIIISPDPAVRADEKKKLLELRAANGEIVSALDKKLHIPAAREFLKAINDTRGPYNEAIDRAIALVEQGKSEAAGALLFSDIRPKQNLLFKAVDDSNNMQRSIAVALARDATDSAGSGAVLLLALAAAMAVIGGGVGWTLNRSLRRSLGAEPSQVSEAVQRVADGDLSVSVLLRSGDNVSTMAAVDRMQRSLASIVSSVRGSAESVATASSQIAQGNHDLSQRTEEQASALQQTAATMDELGSTVRNNADNTRQADQLAVGASEAAAKGGEVVSQVVATMKGINESSRKVADIISVIDGIAFQTNILALNAAVEAARAGEQGRGFAVVAGEVRSLAQRSAEAAKEIKTLISSSVQQVEIGTALVDRAGQTMIETVSAIKRVSDIVSEISSSSAEQSSGVSQVGQAVSQMDQVTQQNAALVEESAAAAESLKGQAAQLVRTVAVFKLVTDRG